MADKASGILLDALRQAVTEPAEHRLFRSGKLPGLFASRTGANAEAAALAVRDELLQIVRSEAKGKRTTEWVRPTPKGIDYVHRHESPLRALEDVHSALQVSREQVPVWLADMRHELQALAGRLTEEARRWSQRLETLSARVEEALRRSQAGPCAPSNGAPAASSWGVEALAYLDRRSESGVPAPCPLPELFAAVRERHPDLAIRTFHEGLRRLRDRHAVQLVAFDGAPAELPEPEYALLDGPALLYYARR